MFAALVAFGGCASRQRAPERAKFFPSLPQARAIDIQVVRHSTRIEMTNTTARSFGEGTLWLNRRFSYDLEPGNPWDVGETRSISLFEFVDEHGERFRAGGFFAAEAPDKLVQAQIEAPGSDGMRELLGLIVVEGEE